MTVFNAALRGARISLASRAAA
ncbi:hypothetical protein STPH1_0264 [Streptomyces sp. OM5714]|nr:hypothetical protein STPH1_0264 [Streptomyces sp. OM5714]